MDKLIELLQQIQDLAGVAIEALSGAAKEGGEGPGETGAPEGPPQGRGQAEGRAPAGGPPPEREPART